jgi:hypothetical protein
VPGMAAMHDAARALIALFDVIEALLCASRNAIDWKELHDCIVTQLRLAQLAFGVAYQKFKHHMPLHIAEMYRKFKKLLNSLVTERKHRRPKRFALARRSQDGYEEGILTDLLVQHFEDMNEFIFRNNGIRSPHEVKNRALKVSVEAVFAGAASVTTGVEYVSKTGAIFHVGDFALLASRDLQRITLAKIWYFFDVDGTQKTVLAAWPSRRVVRASEFARYAHYVTSDETPLVVESSTLACVVVVRQSATSILAIVPRLYQLGFY